MTTWRQIADAPYKWGVNDCITLVEAALHEWTGRKWPLRPEWARRGHGSAVRFARRRFGSVRRCYRDGLERAGLHPAEPWQWGIWVMPSDGRIALLDQRVDMDAAKAPALMGVAAPGHGRRLGHTIHTDGRARWVGDLGVVLAP